MKFAHLKIENFLTVGAAEVALADRGLVLIQGENKDDTSAHSNGAGKSTIADAICWSLFGVTARGASGDDIVNDKAGKGTLVAIAVHDGDDQYVIRRHRKHKTGKNSVHLLHHNTTWAAGTAPADLTKGTDKLTQAEIEKILGCSYDVFRSAVYAAQEEMPNLPAMTDKQLKVLVEEAAGTTQLDAGYEIARQQLLTAKQTLDTVTQNAARFDSLVATAQGQLDAIEAQHAAWEANRGPQVLELARQARAAATASKVFDEDLQKLNKPDLEAKLADAQAKLASVQAEQVEERRLTQLAGHSAQAVSNYEGALQRAKDAAASEKLAHDGVDKLIGCPCQTCSRPLTADEVAPTKAGILSKVRSHVTIAQQVATDLATARADAQTIADALSAHRAGMTDVSATSVLSASLSASIQGAAVIEGKRDQQLAEARRLKAEAEAKAKEVNPHTATVARAKANVDNTVTGKENAKKAVIAAESEVAIAEHVARVFGPAGVRAHILDNVTPFLNDRTARYLGTLSDGNISATWTTLVQNAKGELREKFAIEVENGKGGKKFALQSGGEKRKVRIAATLALQDLAASRAIKPIELFIGDEIDDALDAAGLERLTIVLEEKAREKGTVLIISHADLKDWVRNSITVTKENGVSTIMEIAA